MYLEQMFISKSGPISQLHTEFGFREGKPLPTVFLGTNGRGKTSLLSIITDAIFEAAAQYFDDVLPTKGMGRSWFRVVGGKITQSGATGSYSILRFKHNGADIFFSDKAGNVAPDTVREAIPESLHGGISWDSQTDNHKSMAVSEEQSKAIFRGGSYAYFPSSRSERPYWLNSDSLPNENFDMSNRFSSSLGKPIFAEKNLDQLSQWLMSVILETRRDIVTTPVANGNATYQIISPSHPVFDGEPLLAAANQILRAVVSNGNARFIWVGRQSRQKIGVDLGNGRQVVGLDSLSSGQASLLAIFGTLLRYGDDNGPFQGLDNIEGICVVDEIDSHLHMDLQLGSLPELIALFPKVQFVLSSHSPLFALGMERRFGASGLRLFDLDVGAYINADMFSEFEAAFKALTESEKFEQAVLARAQGVGKPLVLLEDETDPKYLIRAAAALNRKDILEHFEFDWVGTTVNGQAKNGGKDALNSAYNLLVSNSALTNRSVILLYDCDTNKPSETINGVHLRCIPRNDNATIAKRGIENLLPDSVFIAEVYDEKVSEKDYGEETRIKKLNKKRLCDNVCAADTDISVFSNFSVIFEILDQITANQPSSAK